MKKSCAGLSSTARIAKGVGERMGGIVWSPQWDVYDQTMLAMEREEEPNHPPRGLDGYHRSIVHTLVHSYRSKNDATALLPGEKNRARRLHAAGTCHARVC